MKTQTFVVAVLAVFFAVGVAEANVVTGSVGFATPILTQADASPTGNINTSNIFSLQSLVTTKNESGIFAGMPIQNFGTVVFDTGLGNSLHVSDTEFGSFTSGTISTVSNVGGFLNLLITGKWTPGTFNPKLKGMFPGVVRISFTQTPIGIGEISFSGTFSTSAKIMPVPEPPTAILLGLGFSLIVLGTKLRQLWA